MQPNPLSLKLLDHGVRAPRQVGEVGDGSAHGRFRCPGPGPRVRPGAAGVKGLPAAL
jgi:hypothetical protein